MGNWGKSKVATRKHSRGIVGVQDMQSWTRDGIAGLQSVVLYSLPELDGAVDTVPLGGLVGDNIYLVPERVHRLAARLRKWTDLRRTPPQV
jgi:magnesium chelatase subunit H